MNRTVISCVAMFEKLVAGEGFYRELTPFSTDGKTVFWQLKGHMMIMLPVVVGCPINTLFSCQFCPEKYMSPWSA